MWVKMPEAQKGDSVIVANKDWHKGSNPGILVTGNKKIEMVHVKDLLALTGYIRGGVSPIGMKKKFPTYVQKSAELFDEITVSSGTRGAQLLVNSAVLLGFIQAQTADITRKGE